MVHIDPAFLRKYPIAGVVMGLAIAAGTWVVLASGVDETRTLLKQKTPATVSVQEAVGLAGVRWITLIGGTWRCSDAFRVERREMVPRLLFGRIEATEVPITGNGSSEFVVAVFDGDRPCAQTEGQLSGVVGSVDVFGNSATRRRWRAPGTRFVVLDVDASPWKALEMALLMGGIVVAGFLFAGYYVRLMLRRRELS